MQRPPLVDVVIAVAFVAMNLAEALSSEAVTSPVRHVGVAGVALALLAWRRRYPLTVAALVVASNVITDPENQFTTLLSLVLVSFTVGAETEPPRAWFGLAMVFVPFMVVSVVHGFVPSDLAAGMVFFIGPWAVGQVLRGRTLASEAAVARAEQVEREAELEAQRAAVEERTRIARELHDVVSHSISVVAIQTQAVRRRLRPDQQRERDDLAAVEATAREAMAEMRRLFGVLRAEGQTLDLAPQPGLSELPRLVQAVGSGDMSVDLVVEGDPVDLSPGVDLAAYRIAQEGLTNALRHAGARHADVRVRYRPDRLDVSVQDDGCGLEASAGPGHVPGHGLLGIRERVALYGGTVHLEPVPTGGTRLAASLPLKERS
jgi:signal transduction histidine kinase